MYNENYVDNLLESTNLQNMVFDIDFMNEGAISDTIESLLDRFYNLSHYKLTREDLAKPDKVKAAIKNMNLESKRNQKKRALPALIICLISCATGSALGLKSDMDSVDAWKADSQSKMSSIRSIAYSGDKAKEFSKSAETSAQKAKNLEQSSKSYLAGCLVCLGIALAALTVEYVGLISDYDRMIMACERSVKKLKKSLGKESDPKKIKEIENTINKINETQNMLIKKKKDETEAITIRKQGS